MTAAPQHQPATTHDAGPGVTGPDRPTATGDGADASPYQVTRRHTGSAKSAADAKA